MLPLFILPYADPVRLIRENVGSPNFTTAQMWALPTFPFALPSPPSQHNACAGL